MILMKGYVSLTTAAMKMDKNLFTKIIATVAKRGNFILNRHPYLKDFFEIFISGNYHREMKILASGKKLWHLQKMKHLR